MCQITSWHCNGRSHFSRCHSWHAHSHCACALCSGTEKPRKRKRQHPTKGPQQITTLIHGLSLFLCRNRRIRTTFCGGICELVANFSPPQSSPFHLSHVPNVPTHPLRYRTQRTSAGRPFPLVCVWRRHNRRVITNSNGREQPKKTSPPRFTSTAREQRDDGHTPICQNTSHPRLIRTVP